MIKPTSIQPLPPSAAPRATAAPPSDAHACAACQHGHPSDDCFCAHCGQELEDSPLPAAGVGAPAPHAPAAASADAVMDTGDAESAASERVSGAGGAAPRELHTALTCACGQLLPRTARFCLQCGQAVPDGPPRFRLERVAAGSPAGPWDLDQDTVNVGAAADCDVVVADDPYVSRHHARLVRVDDRFVLEDLGSSNGTLLRVRRPIPLEVGDEIVLGTAVLRLAKSA